jgi:uncharacterized protein YeaO (DUF488 family)
LPTALNQEHERMTVDVRTKRIYDAGDADDGYRVLIDHVWPRGVSRERAQLDEWARGLAPSDDLRRWFAHDPAKFTEFRARYRDELSGSEALIELAKRASSRPVTILYAARDTEHNNAVVVAELVRGHATRAS